MIRNKKRRFKHLFSSVCHRHHFSNPNTAEIVFTFLFLGVISQMISFLARDGKY